MGSDEDDSSLYGTGNIDSPIGSTTRNTTGNVSNITKRAHVQSSITKMKEPLDDTNWVVWRERIRCIFRLCNVEPYMYSWLKCPDPATADLEVCDLWDTNDVYAQILITNNILKDQMVHVTRLNTAFEIWQSLQAIHETKDYQIAISIQFSLFRKCAQHISLQMVMILLNISPNSKEIRELHG